MNPTESRNLFILGLTVLLVWMLVIFILARPWWCKKLKQCCGRPVENPETTNLGSAKTVSEQLLNVIEENRRKSVCNVNLDEYKALRRQTLEKLLMEV